MSISSAIAALSPNLWYKLDEGSGTVAHNSGSLANNGTVSGDVAWNVTGPEPGTTALRLFLTGQVLSLAMDINSLTNHSIAMMISSDASGVLNSNYPILGIGDVANRLNRGPALVENHTVAGSPAYMSRWGTNATTINAVPEPKGFWKWIVGTYTTGTNGIKLYIGNTQVGQTSLGAGLAPLLTDPLLVRSDEPAVVAHILYFARVLSLTEVQSVFNEIPIWPYGIPTNQEPEPAGGGGGLTSDQAAQLTDIQTKVADIPGLVDASTFISDTVNTISGVVDTINTNVEQVLANLDSVGGALEVVINDWLTPILQGITTTISNGTDTATATLGEWFRTHALEPLTLDNVTGGPTCARIDHPIIGWYQGLIIRLTTIGPGYVPMAPDQDFYLPALAVVNFYRGVDNWGRVGIHSSNTVIKPLPTNISFVIQNVDILPQPPASRFTVDWAPGVCGEALLMRTP